MHRHLRSTGLSELASDTLSGTLPICSDGMLEQEEMEDGSAIKRIFSNQVEDDEKVRILKGATSENQDNHSAIVIKVISVEDVKSKDSEISIKENIWAQVKRFFN